MAQDAKVGIHYNSPEFMRDVIGLYKILDRIGADGIGEVFRARDTKHGRTVLLRTVSERIAADAPRRERLLADARAGAALSHPFIAATYEVSEEAGTYYLASEFVRGDTVKAVIAGRQLNSTRAAELAVQIADALAEVHASGLVHGGLHPGTVIVTPKGQAKLMDVGLTSWIAGDAGAAARSGDAPPDHRIDIAALGAVLYEMLTGHVPDPTKPAPPGVMKAIPTEFDPIMLKVLSPSLDDNYQSAAALAADLRAVAGVLGERRAKSEAPAPKPAQRPVNIPAHRGAPVRKKAGNLGWIVTLGVLAALIALVWLATRM